MPRIATDSEEPDLACTMKAKGNLSIGRVPVPCFYSSNVEKLSYLIDINIHDGHGTDSNSFGLHLSYLLLKI